MRRGLAPVVIALVLLASLARAAPTPLQNAWHHFEQLEYDQALAALADAKRAAHTAAELADAQLLEGFVQIALDRPDEGLVALRLALRQNLERAAPKNLSPKLTSVFENARALERARALARAGVRISLVQPTVPEVARRAFDVVAGVQGDFAGLSGRLVVQEGGQQTSVPLVRDSSSAFRWLAHVPAALANPSAMLQLRVELIHEGDVIAADPVSSPFALTLPDHDAALLVESPMRDAIVRVDGNDVGHIPFEHPIAVTAGRHRVELVTSQGKVAQSTFIGAGDVSHLVLNVQPRSPLPIVRWVLIGLGAALAITGGVLFAQAAHENDRFNALVTHDPTTSLPTTQYSAAAPTLQQAHAFETAAIATVAVGGAAAVVGLALFAVRGDAHSKVDVGAHGFEVRF